jgi:ketosteroid isomerase-like protein
MRWLVVTMIACSGGTSAPATPPAPPPSATPGSATPASATSPPAITPPPGTAAADPADPFAPLLRVGAQWRYRVLAGQRNAQNPNHGKLAVVPGLTVRAEVLRSHDLKVPAGSDHAPGKYSLVVLGLFVGNEPVEAFAARSGRTYSDDSIIGLSNKVFLVVGPQGLTDVDLGSDSDVGSLDEIPDPYSVPIGHDDLLQLPRVVDDRWKARAGSISLGIVGNATIRRVTARVGDRDTELWQVTWAMAACDSSFGHDETGTNKCLAAGYTRAVDYAPAIGVTRWCSLVAERCLEWLPDGAPAQATDDTADPADQVASVVDGDLLALFAHPFSDDAMFVNATDKPMPANAALTLEAFDKGSGEYRTHYDKDRQIDVARDGKTAWVSLATTLQFRSENGPDRSHDWRVSEVLVKAPGWRVAAMAWTQGVADDAAIRGAIAKPYVAKRFGNGDSSLSDAALKLLRTGFDDPAKVGAKLTAIGSAPGERTSGPVFAKAWNTAWAKNLELYDVAATLAPSGTTGWVILNVALHGKQGTTAYWLPFRLFFVFDKDAAGAWQLVHAHFAVPSNPA